MSRDYHQQKHNTFKRLSAQSRRRRNGTNLSFGFRMIMNQAVLMVLTLTLLVNADSRSSSSIHINTNLRETIEHTNSNTDQIHFLLEETDNENKGTARFLGSDLRNDYRIGNRKGSKRSSSSGDNIFNHGKASNSKASNSSSYKSSKKNSGTIQTPTFPPQTDPPTPPTTTRSPQTPFPTQEPPKEIPTDPPFFRPTPTPAPTGTSPPNTQCVVNNEGLFGAQIGVAEVIAFGYEITVFGTPSVEEEISIVSVMEEGITNAIIDDLFLQCSSASVSTVEGEAKEGQSKRVHHHKSDRRLQQNTFSGVSSRPKDQVEDVRCSGSSLGFECFPVNGQLTIYSTEKMNNAMVNEVRAAITDALRNGNLQGLDNRVLGVSERDLDQFPFPNNGDDDGSVPQTPPPTNSPIGVQNNEDGFPLWAIIVSSVSGVLVVGLLFFCFRRQRRDPKYTDDLSVKEKSDKKEQKKNSKKPFEHPNSSRPAYRPPAANLNTSSFGRPQSGPAGNQIGGAKPLIRVNSNPSAAAQSPAGSRHSFGTAQLSPTGNKNAFGHTNPKSPTANRNAAFGAGPIRSPAGNRNAFGTKPTSPAGNSTATGTHSIGGRVEIIVGTPPDSSGSESDEFEEASLSSEENVSLTDSSGSMQKGLLNPSAPNSNNFGDPDNAFGDPDNAFGIGMPSTSQSERYSSSSSYEEEVEEEYEIEYVEDKEGEEGVGADEEFWDDEVVEEVVEEPEQPSLLPWSSSSSAKM